MVEGQHYKTSGLRLDLLITGRILTVLASATAAILAGCKAVAIEF